MGGVEPLRTVLEAEVAARDEASAPVELHRRAGGVDDGGGEGGHRSAEWRRLDGDIIYADTVAVAGGAEERDLQAVTVGQVVLALRPSRDVGGEGLKPHPRLHAARAVIDAHAILVAAPEGLGVPERELDGRQGTGVEHGGDKAGLRTARGAVEHGVGGAAVCGGGVGVVAAVVVGPRHIAVLVLLTPAAAGGAAALKGLHE